MATLRVDNNNEEWLAVYLFMVIPPLVAEFLVVRSFPGPASRAVLLEWQIVTRSGAQVNPGIDTASGRFIITLEQILTKQETQSRGPSLPPGSRG
jgi:hypothetical protein